MQPDDWVGVKYVFSQNLPANLQEEAQTAQNLSGIVSQETQLRTLSIVDNVQEEIDRIDAENERLKADPAVSSVFGGSDGQ